MNNDYQKYLDEIDQKERNTERAVWVAVAMCAAFMGFAAGYAFTAPEVEERQIGAVDVYVDEMFDNCMDANKNTPRPENFNTMQDWRFSICTAEVNRLFEMGMVK